MLQPATYCQQPVIPVLKKDASISLPLEKLRVNTAGRVYYFPVNDIVRIQAFSNYSKIFFRNEKPVLAAKLLRKFEEQLKKNDFIRVHRTHLVNKRYLHFYIPGETASVFLINGEQVPVARRRRTLLKTRETAR
jgi:two-component system, LytTR family, response regulator